MSLCQLWIKSGKWNCSLFLFSYNSFTFAAFKLDFMTPVVHRGPGHVRMRLLNNNIHVSSELRLGEILVCFVRRSIIALLRVAARTARSFFFATSKLRKAEKKTRRVHKSLNRAGVLRKFRHITRWIIIAFLLHCYSFLPARKTFFSPCCFAYHLGPGTHCMDIVDGWILCFVVWLRTDAAMTISKVENSASRQGFQLHEKKQAQFLALRESRCVWRWSIGWEVEMRISIIMYHATNSQAQQRQQPVFETKNLLNFFSPPAPNPPETYLYCAKKYKSFSFCSKRPHK